MKNLIVFLLIMLNISMVSAQYSMDITPLSGVYKCKIVNSNQTNYPWTDHDLVTWIFPDGQYHQKEIRLNPPTGGPIDPDTDFVEWLPYKANASSVTGEIIAFVAKKGGTGTPPPPQPYVKRINTNYTGNTINTVPAATVLPPGKNCNLGSLWNFSQGAPNYLVVSYANVPCANPLDYIEILYKGTELTVDYTVAYTFGSNLEQISPLGQIVINNTTYDRLRIKPTSTYILNGRYNNVFIKVQSLLPAGQTFSITAISKFCLDGRITDSTYNYVVQGGPHDPNYKIVDIQTLPANQTAPVDLIYTIQFHNNGSAPVMEAIVTDYLPQNLNPETFEIVDFQPMNGIDQYTSPYDLTTDNPKKITFYGPGLHGLGETSPSYAFDQTIFRFKFKVKTIPGIQSTIDNTASIVFLDHINKKNLDPIITNVAQVKYFENCCRWKAFWRNFFNIFRREKKSPCRKPIKGG